VINLAELLALHPDLVEEQIGAYQMCAAIALERQNHAPGVAFAVSLNDELTDETLVWRKRAPHDATMVDMNRATEDGAECLALLVVGRHCAWRVIRRLHSRRRERADWIVEDQSGREIALEVSGTDAGPFEPRVRQKTAQARAAALGGDAASCVVRFLEPKATLWTDHEPNSRTA